MPTEVADFIAGLDQSRPQGSETVSESDDHHRLLKKCLTQTLLGDGVSDHYDIALTVGPRYLNDLPNTYTPDNWVTLDTDQSITGAKTFEAAIQADLGINNVNGDNLISEAADVTAISNYADDTVVLGTDADTLTVAWNAGVDTATVLNTANFVTQVIDVIYPVGSVIYSTDVTNPGVRFTGTTWVAKAAGKFIAGVGSFTDANGDLVNFAAGDIPQGTYNHTLTVAELPAHHHTAYRASNNEDAGSRHTMSTNNDNPEENDNIRTADTGSDTPHNNTPPGEAMYIWERTA